MADEFDRSEASTPKHRAEARRKGQVARSPDVTVVAMLLMALMVLTWMGPIMGHSMIRMFQETFITMRSVGNEIPFRGLVTSVSFLGI